MLLALSQLLRLDRKLILAVSISGSPLAPGVSPMSSQAVTSQIEEGDHLLIAFVSPKPDVTLTTSALREHLEVSLPPYMVPSLFVLMDRLPMLPNGKIDRQHLPAAVLTRPEVDTAYVAPGNGREAAVAAIWEKELGIEGIGIDDHFLEIGGDSIIATLISVRIQEQLQVDVPATALFMFPTVRRLAGEFMSSTDALVPSA